MWTKRMLWMTAIAALAAILPGGCGMTSQDRIDAAKQAVPVAREAVSKIAGEIQKVQVEIAAAQLQLADPNMTGDLAEALRGQYAKLQARLSWLLDQRTKAEQILDRLEQIIAAGPAADANIGDEMVMLGQMLLGGSGYISGDAKGWMAGIGVVLVALGGVLGRIAVKKIGTLNTALDEVVAGGERFKTTVRAGSDAGATIPTVDPVTAFRTSQTATQKHEATRLLVADAQKRINA